MRRLLLAMILCRPSAASAASLGMPSEGFVYFHHAGSDMAAHNAAVEACAGSAAPTIGPMAANFGGVLGAWIADSENNGLAHVTFVANLENCMVARGWEVVR